MLWVESQSLRWVLRRNSPGQWVVSESRRRVGWELSSDRGNGLNSRRNLDGRASTHGARVSEEAPGSG